MTSDLRALTDDGDERTDHGSRRPGNRITGLSVNKEGNQERIHTCDLILGVETLQDVAIYEGADQGERHRGQDVVPGRIIKLEIPCKDGEKCGDGEQNVDGAHLRINRELRHLGIGG